MGSVALAPFAGAEQFGRQESATGIKHSFLIAGATTAIVGEDGEIKWRTKGRSRDAFVLENGNVLVSIANTAKEITREGEVVGTHEHTIADHGRGFLFWPGPVRAGSGV